MGGTLKQNYKVALAAAWLLLVLVLHVNAQAPNFARVDEVFARWDRPDTPGCAVAVIQGGHVVYSQGYGVANLEYDIPITPTTVFHVASLSKQFTALAVALLVADGEISWNDDIRRYVPEVPNLGNLITLRQLATHTSGLRDQWSLLRMAGWRLEGEIIKQQDVLDLVSRQRALNFPAGTDFLYSNTGYTLLALVVERQTGQRLSEFAETRIFAPLGMRHTRFIDNHTSLVRGRADAYRLGDDGVYRLNIPAFETPGPTNLFTTVEDLARWDRNFYTGDVGWRTVLDDIQRPAVLQDGRRISYAAGLVHGRYRGHVTVGHGGADAGYRGEFLRFPDQRLTIVVLCNEPSSDPDRLVRSVADEYLEPEEPTVRAPVVSVPNRAGGTRFANPDGARELPVSGSLDQLTGFYRREESDVPMQLTVRDGVLTILSGGPTGMLIPVGDDSFRLAGSSTVGRFTRSEDGSAILQLSGLLQTRYSQDPRWRPQADELLTFVGSYYSRELGVQYLLSVQGSQLFLRHRRLGTQVLTPTYARGFFTSGFYLAFSQSADGVVDGFTMSTQRAWKIRFDRQ